MGKTVVLILILILGATYWFLHTDTVKEAQEETIEIGRKYIRAPGVVRDMTKRDQRGLAEDEWSKYYTTTGTVEKISGNLVVVNVDGVASGYKVEHESILKGVSRGDIIEFRLSGNRISEIEVQ